MSVEDYLKEDEIEYIMENLERCSNCGHLEMLHSCNFEDACCVNKCFCEKYVEET